MGIERQQIQTHVDFNQREVTLFARGPLDIKPTVLKVPFAIFKAVLATLMKAEAEDEINIMLEMGQMAAAQPEQAAIEEKR